jgi:hypothetical protein
LVNFFFLSVGQKSIKITEMAFEVFIVALCSYVVVWYKLLCLTNKWRSFGRQRMKRVKQKQRQKLSAVRFTYFEH